jgi:hypothetical protein
MRHAKRTKLLTEDINHALILRNVEVILALTIVHCWNRNESNVFHSHCMDSRPPVV